MTKSKALAVKALPSPVGYFYHPLKYLGSIDAVDTRKQISGVMGMPYPADPLVEPEFVGLTYYQVALLRQAERSARHGDLASLEFFSDRMIGRPAQVNVNVNANESYTDFLKTIAAEEEKITDVTPEWKLE